MAMIELATLKEHLEDDEVRALEKTLSETSSPKLDIDNTADTVVLDHEVDADMLVDFLDRLDANEASADIYLPIDFDDVIESGDHRFGSAHTLIQVLDSMKEELFENGEESAASDEEEEEEEEEADFDSYEDDDEDAEEDEDEGEDMKAEQLRHIWRLLYKGARTSIQRGLCLFVHS